MNKKQLWKFIENHKKAHKKMLCKDFIWIKKADFKKIEKYFIPEQNFFHKGDSFRSKNLIEHIHAIAQGDYFLLHKDTGNIAIFLPLGLIHLFFDVIPYLAYISIKRPRTPLIQYPEKKTCQK
ncbi:MAG: hypothetical protein N4A36_03995 [Candidatus Gracilibacteria bacterium]|jgi:hypothetical protein|nr:hypothetical protein [Candidatus Gracilibacteria bacterium]